MTAHPTRLPMNALRREPETLLDGTWQFQLLPEPGATASQEWKAVEVPSLWTMSERSDPPHYTNVVMPFAEALPDVPKANPEGVYRRGVTLHPVPHRRTILHIGAAEGYLRVNVNGQEIGTSTDSHLAAEFDVTDALVDGENSIELRVRKWSIESYLEDQDQWWQFGISRSVWLYSVPEVRLADVITVADYDPEAGAGSLRVDVRTTGLNELIETGHTVRIRVLDQEHEKQVAGRIAAAGLPPGNTDRSTRPTPMLPPDILDLVSMQAAAAPIPPEFRAIPNVMAAHTAGDPAATAVFALHELDVAPWSAERPHLEELVVDLLDGTGSIVDSATFRIGFRRVQIVGRDLLINGERVLIQGVNRHDFDPRTGRVISRERMHDELSLLKRFNVNAIRTSHYPNDPYFLDLCDEYGFYVVDEADVEGHGYASGIPDNPLFLEPILERIKRMVLRDRNHAAVIIWSLGNETGYGAAHDAAAAWVRRTDPTRPVQYEGAVSLDWHGGQAASDILCPMYPAFQALEAHAYDPAADRPLITCEYAYSQGNGTGGLAEYWRLFETLPGLQGGFIWEFVDHALDRDGDGHYRYGGDFGDHPNDGPVLLNGIAFADLTPKPALFEARGIFSPVRIVSDAAAARDGRVRLRSRRHFADVSDLVFTVHVDTRRGAGAAVRLPVELDAGREATFELPGQIVEGLRDADALALTLTVATRDDSAWADAGTELAVHQVILSTSPRRLLAGDPADVTPAGSIEHPLLIDPPQLSLWRAMTDGDNSFALDNRFVRSGFFELTARSVEVTADEDATVVRIDYATAWDETIEHTRRISTVGSSDFIFEERVTLPSDTRDGLAVGIAFRLLDGFEKAEWVGLGPWENYPDRRESALLGRWGSAIDDLAVRYVVPQGNGARGGVDEAVLSGPAGSIVMGSEVPMYLTVSRYSDAQLETAAHWWELPDSAATYVHFDVAQRGVGTALLGPDARPAFRLSGATYSWRWRLSFTPAP